MSDWVTGMLDGLSVLGNFIVASVAVPFLYFLELDQRVNLLYLAVAFLLAGWAFIRGVNKDSPDSHRSGLLARLKLFLGFCFPKKVYFHKSAKVDYLYFVVNTITFPWFIAPLIIGTTAVSHFSTDIFMQATFLKDVMGEVSWGGRIAFTVGLLLAFDGGIYIAHYLQHRVPALWEFHKVHHSAEVLTPITVYRMHPVDDFLTGSLTGILIGFVMGLFNTLYSQDLSFYEVAGLNAGVFVFYFFGYNLRHSHVWLAYHPLVSHIFISPAQHQIHHSIDPKHYTRNLGFIFAFWDWLGGTLYVPKGKEEITYGISGERASEFSTVYRLYWRPFVRVYRHFFKSRVNARS